jgi:uncharacterized RDD family membrane protein YckC
MSDHTFNDEPATPIHGTRAGKRYLAAVVDNLVAIILALAAAQQLPLRHEMTQGLSAYVFYLAYYAITEGLFATTPAKWFFDLRVVGRDGRRCGMWQAILRTLGRILDANPLLLGAAPAALLVWCTRGRQHIGDFMAGTYVVHAADVRRT